MENGHELYCTTIKSKPEDGWQWGIYDNNQEDPNDRAYPIYRGGQNWGRPEKDEPNDHLPTLEHAHRQAEDHYQKLFPVGTDTGSHDSGVDYSDLNKFMGNL